MKKRQFDKSEISCGDVSLDALNIEEDKKHVLIAKEYNSNLEHPTPEQLFIRQAVKYLTPKQRAVWEYYNYDRLTQDDIAKKMKITQQMVTQHIQACEKRIAKWCASNIGAYNLIKQEMEKE